jgi:hypothetical protein
MAWIAIGSAAVSAVGGIAAAAMTPKTSTPAYQPLDIAKVITDARTNAAQNYQQSFALEQQYNPQQAALRSQNNASLSNLVSGNTPQQTAANNFLGTFNSPVTTGAAAATNPLLQQSNAAILAQLGLGGALPADTQAQIAKASLEQGGAAGISGSGAARGLVARDIGTSSLNLLNQRIGAAQTAGTNTASLNLQGQQLSLQDYIARLGGAQNAAGQQTQNASLLASYTNAQQLPTSGLDPGAIASLYAGQNNAQNQYNLQAAANSQAQKNSNMNAMLGFGSLLNSSGASGAIAGGLASYFGGSGGAAASGLTGSMINGGLSIM